MKFIKILLLSFLCLSSVSYAQAFFRIKDLSKPVELSYTYWGHGGDAALEKMFFELSTSGKIARVTVTNMTVENYIEKLAKMDSKDEEISSLNPEAMSSIVIDANSNKDDFFYISYFIARGSDTSDKYRTLMVTSGENELFIDIEYSNGNSSKGIEILNVEAKMHY